MGGEVQNTLVTSNGNHASMEPVQCVDTDLIRKWLGDRRRAIQMEIGYYEKKRECLLIELGYIEDKLGVTRTKSRIR